MMILRMQVISRSLIRLSEELPNPGGMAHGSGENEEMGWRPTNLCATKRPAEKGLRSISLSWISLLEQIRLEYLSTHGFEL